MRSRSRLMSSSQTDTPALVSSLSTSLMCRGSFRCSTFVRPAAQERALARWLALAAAATASAVMPNSLYRVFSSAEAP